METRIYICELRKHIGEEIYLCGFVNSIRDQKSMQFIIVRDLTGMVQVTIEKKGSELNNIISTLTPESTVKIHGKVVQDDRVKLNGLEIILDDLEVTSHSNTIPIDEKTSLEDRLDWRFIDLRQPKNNLIFKIQTTAEKAMRDYWINNGFIEIHSPKFVEGATESGSELFQLDYFGKKASLAQSPQFYKQMAMAAGFERVFEIGPVFRANPSFTSRHDTEFTSVDVEISFIDSHEDVMRFEENWLQHVLSEVQLIHSDKIKEYFNVKVEVPKVPFPRISMEEAYSILRKLNYDVPREKKGDLDPEGERLISRYVKENFDHEFVFITDYPISARPFYHMRYSDNNKLTKSYDLIWKGVEVTTGAQREHRYDNLLDQARENGIDLDAIAYYLDFFKYGCPPHGGFGFGLTRMLMMLLETKNVREVTYLYRGPNRLTP